MKRTRFFIIGIILLALTIGMAKANYYGSNQQEKQSTAYARINVAETEYSDNGDNITITDDDYTVLAGTRWHHTNSSFQHKVAEYSLTRANKVDFPAEHILIIRFNPVADVGSDTIRFYMDTDDAAGNPTNGYVFTDDIDGLTAPRVICGGATGNVLNSASLPIGYITNNNDYVLKFISNETHLFSFISTDNGIGWINIGMFNNCSTSTSDNLRLALYDDDANLEVHDITFHANLDSMEVGQVFSISFEQNTTVDDGMCSKYLEVVNESISYDSTLQSYVSSWEQTTGASIRVNVSDLTKMNNSETWTISTMGYFYESQLTPIWLDHRTGGSGVGIEIQHHTSGSYMSFRWENNTGGSLGESTTSGSFPFEEWHHYAAVSHGNGSISQYIDGVLDDVFFVPGDLGIDIAMLTIGRRRNSAFVNNGSLDCIEMHASALSPTQISEHYSNCINTHGVATITQGTNITAISTNGTEVEGWFVGGQKVATGDSIILNVSTYQQTVCANMTNPTDNAWSNCAYVNQYGVFSLINLTSISGLEGTNITENITISHLGNSITGNIPLSLITDAGTSNLTITPTGWIPQSTSLTTLLNVMHNVTQVGTANAELNFIGNVSGDTFYPQCTIGGSLFNNAVNEYEIPSGTNTIICEEDTDYQEMSFSVIWNQTDYANDTFELGEYYIVLNFTANTSGNVVWTQPNDDGDCCQIPSFEDTADYNQTIFQWIKVSSQFQQDDLVSIRFNNQTNDTLAQYYEFYNDRDTIRRDHVGVLTTLDYVLWVNVYNYGNDELYEATVTVYHYPNETYTDGFVVQKRITRPMLGDARPGVPVYLDKSIDYHIVVTADGYQTETVHTRGIDLENNEPLDFKLRPNTQDIEYDWLISGQSQHSNESILIYTISTGDQSRIYWDTDINPFVAGISLEMGGGTISLTRGIHYSGGTDFDLRLYSYNSTLATYVLRGDANITYVARGDFEIQGQLTQNNNIIAFLLFIALIAISSILGSLIKMNGADDTGYYIFGFGSIVLAIVYTQLLPMAGIIALGTLGSAIINTTKD